MLTRILIHPENRILSSYGSDFGLAIAPPFVAITSFAFAPAGAESEAATSALPDAAPATLSQVERDGSGNGDTGQIAAGGASWAPLPGPVSQQYAAMAAPATDVAAPSGVANGGLTPFDFGTALRSGSSSSEPQTIGGPAATAAQAATILPAPPAPAASLVQDTLGAAMPQLITGDPLVGTPNAVAIPAAAAEVAAAAAPLEAPSLPLELPLAAPAAGLLSVTPGTLLDDVGSGERTGEPVPDALATVADVAAVEFIAAPEALVPTLPQTSVPTLLSSVTDVVAPEVPQILPAAPVADIATAISAAAAPELGAVLAEATSGPLANPAAPVADIATAISAAAAPELGAVLAEATSSPPTDLAAPVADTTAAISTAAAPELGAVLAEATSGPLADPAPAAEEAGDGLAEMGGSDPAAGVVTLVNMVSTADVFDLRQTDASAAPPPQQEGQPDLLDALGAEAPSAVTADEPDIVAGILPGVAPPPPPLDLDPLGGLG